jgi:hypothetical protein
MKPREYHKIIRDIESGKVIPTTAQIREGWADPLIEDLYWRVVGPVFKSYLENFPRNEEYSLGMPKRTITTARPPADCTPPARV